MHYQDLVDRYGNDGAYDMLTIIEKLARIKSFDATMTEEQRLQHAMEKLNEIDYSNEALVNEVSAEIDAERAAQREAEANKTKAAQS